MDFIDLMRKAQNRKPVADLPSGEELARLRKAAGLSRTDFAAAARISVLALIRFERGETQPHAATSLALRRVLAVIA